jgi:hypothetical protein
MSDEILGTMQRSEIAPPVHIPDYDAEPLDGGGNRFFVPLLGLCGEYSLIMAPGSTAWIIRLRRDD